MLIIFIFFRPQFSLIYLFGSNVIAGSSLTKKDPTGCANYGIGGFVY